MGFTIEDMLVVGADRYQMKLIAGRNGWSNSISWLLMLEDHTIIQNFSGKELAVTTCLGFQTEEEMLALVRELSSHDASGLLINNGYYVQDIPASVTAYCDENDLPLLTVPWEVYLGDLIKDFTVRIFLQGTTDEQISAALIRAVEQPERRSLYEGDLLAHFDLDGSFQVALVTTEDLDRMDTVDRRRIGYRMQLYITNLTHNGHFFYYDGCFVIVMNAMTEEEGEEILESFVLRAQRKMPEHPLFIGVSDLVTDISRLRAAYRRAKAAVTLSLAQVRQGMPLLPASGAADTGPGAETDGKMPGHESIAPGHTNPGKGNLVYFSRMGVYQLLYLVDDRELLTGFAEKALKPLLDYDEKHHADYVETLDCWLHCGGSIREMSEVLFLHRNTILYRMSNIRRLLDSRLEDPQEQLALRIACMIHRM